MRKILSKHGHLDEVYQNIYNKATRGVIYMSFGSNADSSTMSDEFKENLFRAFEKFKDIQVRELHFIYFRILKSSLP